MFTPRIKTASSSSSSSSLQTPSHLLHVLKLTDLVHCYHSGGVDLAVQTNCISDVAGRLVVYVYYHTGLQPYYSGEGVCQLCANSSNDARQSIGTTKRLRKKRVVRRRFTQADHTISNKSFGCDALYADSNRQRSICFSILV